MTKTSRHILFFIAAVAFLALLFGMWFQYNLGYTSKSYEKSLQTATVLPQARQLSPFKLVDTKKHAFTNKNLNGHWSLVFFGFTNCPMLCPTTLSVLNNVYKKFDADKLPSMPQVVFISIDPRRDSPKRIQKYLASFNTHFIGATGSKAQLDQLTNELSVMYMMLTKKDANEEGVYDVNHSGTIIVLNPKGQFYALFSTPHNVGSIVHDFELLQAHYHA